MSAMEVTREDQRTIVGPCPGCSVWTIEFTEGVRVEYTAQEFADLIEGLLQLHLNDCKGLREVVANLRS